MKHQKDTDQTKAKGIDELRFLVFFECPGCGELLNYHNNCLVVDGQRKLFCACGFEKFTPLASRFVNYNPDSKGFDCKWGAVKKTRGIRLTQEAWDNLEQIAKELGVNRADLIECWARALTTDEMTSWALQEQIKSQIGYAVPQIGDVVLSPTNKLKPAGS